MTFSQFINAVMQKIFGYKVCYDIMYADTANICFRKNPEITLRPMTAGDTDYLASRVTDYFSSPAHHTFKKTPILNNDPLYEGYMCYDKQGSFIGYCFVMMKGSRYELFRIRKADAYIAEAYVDKACRSRGLGADMMSGVFSLLKEKGLKNIAGAIRTTNKASIRCCEKAGFVFKKRVTIFVGATRSTPYYSL